MTTTQGLEMQNTRHAHWLVASYEAATADSEVNRIADFYRVESLTAFGTGIFKVEAQPIEPVMLVVTSQSPAIPAAVIVASETDAVVIETAVAAGQ